MVAAGAGVAIVPQSAARRCGRSMAMSVVRLSDAWATRRLNLCAGDFDTLSPLAKDLAAHLAPPPS